MSEEHRKAKHDCYLFIELVHSGERGEKVVIQGTGETPKSARELFDHALKKYKEEFKDK